MNNHRLLLFAKKPDGFRSQALFQLRSWSNIRSIADYQFPPLAHLVLYKKCLHFLPKHSWLYQNVNDLFSRCILLYQNDNGFHAVSRFTT